MFALPSPHFKKAAKKLPIKVRAALAKRLELFMEWPFDPILNNHPLRGSMRSYRSINITGDYRLIYESYDSETIRLIDIGTHTELYGR